MISILTPFRNAAPWLAQMVDSVLAQSDADWELILVDDHSTDASREIASAYHAKDPRIYLLSNTDRGIISALQTALGAAAGEFVTRMDADDIMPTDRLEAMRRAMMNAPERTLVTGQVRYFSEGEVSPGYRKYENWLNTRVHNRDHWDHLYRECVIASPNWLVRRKELLADCIFEKLRYPEDYDMVFRWYAAGYKVVPLDQVTLYWREHPARTSRNSKIYDQASFFELKLGWFMKLMKPNSPIGIVGAGQKGKRCARFLNREKVLFRIYDLNFAENKKVIGAPIEDPDLLKEELILLARYPEDPTKLEDFLKGKGYVIGRNAFWL